MVRVAVATIPVVKCHQAAGSHRLSWLTRLYGGMTDVDKNHVHGGLWWADHVLSGRNEFDNRVVQFVSGPSVSRLIPCLIPIKELRNFVRHATHTTPPTVNTGQRVTEVFNVYQTRRLPLSMNWT
jgi:hypothetical protein